MNKSLSAQVASLRKEKAQLKVKVAELEKYIESLQKTINGDDLEYWQLPLHPKYENSSPDRWFFPVYEYLNNKVDAKTRNHVMDILNAIIRQFIAYFRYDLLLPIEPRDLDYEYSDNEKKNKIQHSCLICGETRITNECHIIPRAHSGPNHPDNFLFLCANHHFLFDHGHLTEAEFLKLVEAVDLLNFESAKIYMRNVHLRSHLWFWGVLINPRADEDIKQAVIDWNNKWPPRA